MQKLLYHRYIFLYSDHCSYRTISWSRVITSILLTTLGKGLIHRCPAGPGPRGQSASGGHVIARGSDSASRVPADRPGVVSAWGPRVEPSRRTPCFGPTSVFEVTFLPGDGKFNDLSELFLLKFRLPLGQRHFQYVCQLCKYMWIMRPRRTGRKSDAPVITGAGKRGSPRTCLRRAPVKWPRAMDSHSNLISEF